MKTATKPTGVYPEQYILMQNLIYQCKLVNELSVFVLIQGKSHNRSKCKRDCMQFLRLLVLPTSDSTTSNIPEANSVTNSKNTLFVIALTSEYFVCFFDHETRCNKNICLQLSA